MQRQIEAFADVASLIFAAQIFDAQDEAFVGAVTALSAGKCPRRENIISVVEHCVQMFDKLSTTICAKKLPEDVQDIGKRLLHCILSRRPRGTARPQGRHHHRPGSFIRRTHEISSQGVPGIILLSGGIAPSVDHGALAGVDGHYRNATNFCGFRPTTQIFLDAEEGFRASILRRGMHGSLWKIKAEGRKSRGAQVSAAAVKKTVTGELGTPCPAFGQPPTFERFETRT